MEQLQTYIKPELLILIPVLYLLGMGIRRSKLDNKYIPLTLGIAGILLATLYTVATLKTFTLQCILLGAFTGVTQGVLAAGTSVYVNQLVKQTKNNSGKDE